MKWDKSRVELKQGDSIRVRIGDIIFRFGMHKNRFHSTVNRFYFKACQNGTVCGLIATNNP